MPSKEEYRRFKLEGKCPSCGKERDNLRFQKCSKCRESVQKWKRANKEKVAKYEKLRHQKNPSTYTRKLREQIIRILGEKCNNPECPIPRDRINIRGLEIDHVRGHGNEERKKIIGKTGSQYYKAILQKVKEGSEDYQVLCAYCNRLKQAIFKEHRTKEYLSN